MSGGPAQSPVFAWVCEPCAATYTAPEPWGEWSFNRVGSGRASHEKTGTCFVCQQTKRPRVEWRPLIPTPTAEELLS